MHDVQCIYRFSSFDLGSPLKSNSYVLAFPRNRQLYHFLFLTGAVTGIWTDPLFLLGKIMYEGDDLMTCTL